MPSNDELREVAEKLRWKVIEEYPNYEVSDGGEVKNTTTGKLLSPYRNQRGYLKVCLYKDGKKKYLSVHRLVANAFVTNEDPGIFTQVNHIDEDKANNRADNLEWVTPSENINHGTCIERRAKAQSRTVEMTYKGLTVLFDSTRDASEKTGIPRKYIQGVCQGKCKTTMGASFRYINDGEKVIEPEERTCRMELRKRGATYDVFYFDCCDEEYSENRTDQYASGISGRVCPNCGARVTE